MRRTIISKQTMRNDRQISILGFGTWNLPNNEEGSAAVQAALDYGYRHIDTAAAYENEEAVAQGIKQSDIKLKRNDLFLTTKLSNQVRGYDETIEAVNESLEKLDTKFIDLYLIHWPKPYKFRDNWEEANAETWRAMEDLYDKGVLKAIGVSNFKPHHLEELAKTARIMPHVNQIKLCPGVQDPETVEYCREHGILIEAYSPLGHGEILDNETLKIIAAKYDKSPAQIALRSGLEKDYILLPKSAHEERIRENSDIFDFSLTNDDRNAIDKLDFPEYYPSDPDKIKF